MVVEKVSMRLVEKFWRGMALQKGSHVLVNGTAGYCLGEDEVDKYLTAAGGVRHTVIESKCGAA
jgi:hypothetical protein